MAQPQCGAAAVAAPSAAASKIAAAIALTLAQLFLVGVEDAVQLADAGEAIGGEEAWAELLLSMVGTTPQEFNLSPEVRCNGCDMRRESARFGRPMPTAAMLGLAAAGELHGHQECSQLAVK